jgi:hypothetical protein
VLQAACTPKELKELVTMPTIAVNAQPEQLAVSDSDKAEMKAVRLKRRVYELISSVSTPEPGLAVRLAGETADCGLTLNCRGVPVAALQQFVWQVLLCRQAPHTC